MTRPQTRAECPDWRYESACPYACRHNLLYDIGKAGALRVAGLRVLEYGAGGRTLSQRVDDDAVAEAIAMHRGPSCALDVADGGWHTLGEVGELLDPPVTRERVRQIETGAMRTLKRKRPEVHELLREYGRLQRERGVETWKDERPERKTWRRVGRRTR